MYDYQIKGWEHFENNYRMHPKLKNKIQEIYKGMADIVDKSRAVAVRVLSCRGVV